MLIRKEIIIKQPMHRVYAYALDFSQLYEWDDHVVEGRRVDLGPIGVGSQFQFTYSFFGQLQTLEYTLESFSENSYIELSCRAPTFGAIDRMTFAAENIQETRVTYEANIDVGSSLKDRLIAPIMDKIGQRVVCRLQEVLEKPETIQQQGKKLSILNVPFRFTTKGWNSRRKQFSATTAQSKTVLITGPTSGLGKAATYTLAGKGCNLILVGRSEEKLTALKKDLLAHKFSKKIFLYTCDMQDLDMVRQTCSQIIDDGHRLDVLINNAGSLFAEPRMISSVERTTVVDLIAPWIMTCKLLPQIQQGGCLINVSSGGMYGASLSISQLKKAAKPFSGAKAYAQAKRAMNVFTRGLNQEIASKGIRVHAMHPGWADTPGVLNSLPGFYQLTRRWLRTPFQGAETIVWLALNNPQEGGAFWLDRQIQPDHILSSTRGKDEYGRLRKFLDTFAVPSH